MTARKETGSRSIRRRLLGFAAAARLRTGLIWRPRTRRNMTRDLDNIARLAKLGRRQAIILAALEHTPEDKKRYPWVERIYLMRRNRVRAAMHRFEELGFIESAWAVSTGGATCVVTNSGSRVGRAVRRVLGAEDYPGEPRRFGPR